MPNWECQYKNVGKFPEVSRNQENSKKQQKQQWPRKLKCPITDVGSVYDVLVKFLVIWEDDGEICVLHGLQFLSWCHPMFLQATVRAVNMLKRIQEHTSNGKDDSPILQPPTSSCD